MKQQNLLKIEEVAERLGVSRALVYRLIQGGVLPRIKIAGATRVAPEDLERFIESSRGGQA